MSKFILTIIICSFFFVGSIIAAPDSTATGPRLSIDSTEHDFGEIEAGVNVEHVFVLENTGIDTLRIANVYSS